jgi:hypothetical protein
MQQQHQQQVINKASLTNMMIHFQIQENNENNKQSTPLNQPTLADYLKQLREKSAREKKIVKYRRLYIEKYKNPNEYKVTDFFPKIR